MNNPELKPCPFCGSPAVIKRNKTTMVKCSKCSAATFQQLSDVDSAINDWNRRGGGADVSNQESGTKLQFSDAVKMARGCSDYGGGYRGTEHYEAFQDGISTVVRVLEAAQEKGLSTMQLKVLHRIGSENE